MIESMKKMEILHAIKISGMSDTPYTDLIAQLFLDFPNLKNIEVSKTQEYNDNDYSTYFRIVSVNGLNIVDDCYDDENYDEVLVQDPNSIYNDIELNHIINAIQSTESYFDDNYGDDVQTLSREDFVNRKTKPLTENKKAFNAYYFAVENNQKISDFSVFKNNPNWALYYCIDLNEKLPEDIFNKIFKKEIKYAYFYAENVLKDRLPKSIEKYFDEIEKKLSFKSFENSNQSTYEDRMNKYYISKYREFVKNLCSTN